MVLRLPTSSICNISKCCHSSNAIVTALNMAGRRTFLDDMTYYWRRYNNVICWFCLQRIVIVSVALSIATTCSNNRNFQDYDNKDK
uniref:Uncharacterized protein n=1 Tax=Glossina palpalis gambiensis TaxID=67801 RepID=A0A1B0B928_9MUSC